MRDEAFARLGVDHCAQAVGIEIADDVQVQSAALAAGETRVVEGDVGFAGEAAACVGEADAPVDAAGRGFSPDRRERGDGRMLDGGRAGKRAPALAPRCNDRAVGDGDIERGVEAFAAPCRQDWPACADVSACKRALAGDADFGRFVRRDLRGSYKSQWRAAQAPAQIELGLDRAVRAGGG